MSDWPSPQIGMRLPQLSVPVTRKMIIFGALASRDWQPQHHDPVLAVEAGLPDIIMNNYTQAGLIGRYITDWTGPHGRIGRFSFAMRKPLLPGSTATINGMVVDIAPAQGGIIWAEIDIEVMRDDVIATTASVKVALPSSTTSPSPWHCPSSLWRP